MVKNKNIRYLNINATDEKWGIVVTTAGSQLIPPHSHYPLPQHPLSYIFCSQQGRVLEEYQLVYISKGSGLFESRSCKKRPVKAGTMILLFPGEWHTYSPDPESGWYEHWVGFKGNYIEMQMENKFFTKENPVYEIGVNNTFIGFYEDILAYASEERMGYQQLISSIVLYLLGYVYYTNKNVSFNDSIAIEKINSAKALMKKNIEHPLPIEDIAGQLNVSYSWFRRMFKEYTGTSPAQYQLQLRYIRAKELLSTTQMNISEIADQLSFENTGQFSTFFRKKEGISPSQFREKK